MQNVLVIALQVPSKESLPSDEDLAKEVVSVLSGVNVLEFNIKMLMKHLSKHLCTLLVDLSCFGAVTCLTSHFLQNFDCCMFADGKYKVDLKEKKPLIKTIAIQYCTEHAPKNNEEDAE